MEISANMQSPIPSMYKLLQFDWMKLQVKSSKYKIQNK